jgi:hypothetical protein
MAEEYVRYVSDDEDLGEQVDLKEFQVPARDEKGHSERTQCRLPAAMLWEMQRIFQSGRFGYRSLGDLQRHAFMRHMEWLSGISPAPNNVIYQLEAINMLLREDDQQVQFDAAFNRLGEQVARHMQSGDQTRAQSLLLQFKIIVDKMDDPAWKGQYQRALETKYGWVLHAGNNVQPMSLLLGEEVRRDS